MSEKKQNIAMKELKKYKLQKIALEEIKVNVRKLRHIEEKIKKYKELK